MIQRLSLHNFKCFVSETLELAPLTLLTGVNGVGKSSVLQALLLLRQAEIAPSNEPFVKLNGRDQLQLGQASDVLCRAAKDDPTQIRMVAHGAVGEGEWTFDAHTDTDRALKFQRAHAEKFPELAEAPFVYLHAERLGPRQALGLHSLPTDAIHVGALGEYVAHVLTQHQDTSVRPELLHPKTEDIHQLRIQVELWMQALVPGIKVKSKIDPDFGTSGLWWTRGGVTSEWVSATNMGFGASYSVPIVVAGLLAKKGSLFLVENPEAHLHPSGQSAMGRFLATLAAAGVQVVCETHSDHILNGIRLAAIDARHALRSDQVRVHFFSQSQDRTLSTQQLTLSKKGDLSAWPPGFFDQTEQDLRELLHARTRAGETAKKLRERTRS